MEFDEDQVRVKFVTKNALIRVTESPFAVPVTLARHGLSQVINHLLELTPPRPFDFLIEGQFLRTTLKKYMLQHQLSEENELTLEYCEAWSQPNESNQQQLPDWVSCVASLSKLFVSGCYDGCFRVHLTASGEIVQSCKAHDGPIKAIQVYLDDATSMEHARHVLVVTSGKDHSIKTWKVDTQTYQCIPVSECLGHLNSVEALAISVGTTTTQTQNRLPSRWLASGGWDNLVCLWKLSSTTDATEESIKKEEVEEEEEEEENEAHFTKKARVSGKSNASTFAIPTFTTRKPHLTFTGHSGCVNGVAFDDATAHELWTASWDRSIKLWDVETQLCKQSISSNQAFTDLSLNNTSTSSGASLLATASPDHVVRIWDRRAACDGSNAALQLSLKSHQAWVSSVTWQPNSDVMLLSGAFDGTIKQWDIRSQLPLCTHEAHPQHKVLDVSWILPDGRNQKGTGFISGGSDCKIKMFTSEAKQLATAAVDDQPSHVATANATANANAP